MLKVWILFVVRSDSVINQFGRGLNNEAPRDAIDHQVLTSGTAYKKSEESSSSAKLRVTTPYIAKAHNTPDCLSCHNAKEGEVLGVISMVFDIGDSRTNGLLTSLVILLFSIIIMVLMSLSSIVPQSLFWNSFILLILLWKKCM